MQIALTRTVDAGKIAEQLEQKGQLQAQQASQAMDEEVLKKRKTVQNMEKSEQTRLKKREKQRRNKKQKNKNAENHPFKGNKIDYNG